MWWILQAYYDVYRILKLLAILDFRNSLFFSCVALVPLLFLIQFPPLQFPLLHFHLFIRSSSLLSIHFFLALYRLSSSSSSPFCTSFILYLLSFLLLPLLMRWKRTSHKSINWLLGIPLRSLYSMPLLYRYIKNCASKHSFLANKNRPVRITWSMNEYFNISSPIVELI